MFEKSRKRIVAAIMSVLTLLFLGTLAVIYISSYSEVAASNYEMLEHHVQRYLDETPAIDSPFGGRGPEKGGMTKGMPEGGHREEPPAFWLSTFYSVAVSKDGEVLTVDNGDGTVYEEEELTEYALEILAADGKKGVRGSLLYYVERQSGYNLVAFMDNTIMQESMTTLFRYTLVFGSAAMIGLYMVAVQLAKRIVRPLEESYQKQKQFISDAGHELKTPVSVVSANAELLSRELGENQWLSNIQYENERMGKLVSQLLELARTENVAPTLETLDLSRLVAGEALPFESIAFEKGLVMETEISKGIQVEGDGMKLKQLVSIMIDNAMRHSRGREIQIVLKEERGNATLSVINQGEEIRPELREQIFERFYRIDESRSGEGGHYGLGLAIAKAIVAAHKGKIGVRCHDGMVEFVTEIPKLNQK